MKHDVSALTSVHAAYGTTAFPILIAIDDGRVQTMTMEQARVLVAKLQEILDASGPAPIDGEATQQLCSLLMNRIDRFKVGSPQRYFAESAAIAHLNELYDATPLQLSESLGINEDLLPGMIEFQRKVGKLRP